MSTSILKLKTHRYALFLDESMMYSCAIHAPGRSLYDSQMAKLDAVIEAAQLTADDSVLEIGCGWGAFAIRAAQKTGCRVTGLTLSKEQLAEATARVEAAGLTDRITLLLCDYRCGVIAKTTPLACCRRLLPLPRAKAAHNSNAHNARASKQTNHSNTKQGLPRRGDVRQGRLHRDDRGGRPRAPALLLWADRAHAQAGRPLRDPGALRVLGSAWVVYVLCVLCVCLCV